MDELQPLDRSLDSADLSLLDRAFYMEIWHERVHKCECCDTDLYEPRLYMFHHILEKRVKIHTPYSDYSRFRHCKWNIALLCWQCHTTYETHPGSKVVIYIVAEKDRLLAILDDGDFSYDTQHIWNNDDVPDVTVIQQLFGKHKIDYETDI